MEKYTTVAPLQNAIKRFSYECILLTVDDLEVKLGLVKTAWVLLAADALEVKLGSGENSMSPDLCYFHRCVSRVSYLRLMLFSPLGLQL